MASLRITGFDHLVLRCADVERTLAWYIDTLGLAPVRVDEWRRGEVPFPSARVSDSTIIDFVAAGSPVTDRNVEHICLVADRATVDAVAADTETFRQTGERGIRYGARGDGWSVYIYDPDDNVVEIRSYEP